jgi:hypothetical protein
MQPTQTTGEFCITLRPGKEEIRTLAVYLGNLFPCFSPLSVCQAYVPLQEKEEEGAVNFLLFIALIIFVVNCDQISAFCSWYYNNLLIQWPRCRLAAA